MTKKNTEKVLKIPFKLVSITGGIIIVTLAVGVLAYLYTNNQEEKIYRQIISKKSASSSFSLIKTDSCKVLAKDIKKSIENNKVQQNVATYRDTGSLDEMAATSQEDSNAKSSDYTGTNNQEKNVDEGDVVKYDGDYIYSYARSQENYKSTSYISVNKIDKETGKITPQGKVVFRDKINFVKTLNLYNNKLIVVAEVYDNQTSESENTSKISSSSLSLKMPENIGKNYTKVLVYNTEDKSKINLEKSFRVDGSVQTTRTIGENLYLVSNNYNYGFYNLLEQNIKDENITKIQESLERRIPVIGEISENKIKSNCDISYTYPIVDYNISSVVGINLNTYKINSSKFMGTGNNVYVSQDNLYLTKNNHRYYNNVEQKTSIFKFKLDEGKVSFKTKGTVPGVLLNQFSMSQYGDYFRVATNLIQKVKKTTDYIKPGENVNVSDTKQTSGVYVLDKDLKIVSSKTGLASGERIYAVRFLADKVYVVTFKQVDPLFVLKVDKKGKIELKGELKIPGYSNYLHPINGDLLLGVGKDTKVIKNNYGERVVNDGVKLSLFDVKDLTNPKELDSKIYGTSGSYSHVDYDHKAFTYSKNKNLIVLPIAVYDKNNDSKYGKLTRQGSFVFKIEDSKIIEKYFVTHWEDKNQPQEKDEFYYNNNQPNIKRQYLVKDYLITVSDRHIQVDNLTKAGKIDKVQI